MRQHSRIQELSDMVNLKCGTFLYSRLHTLRASLVPAMKAEPLSFRVVWLNEDRDVAFSWAFMNERIFNLSKIQLLTFKLVEELNENCRFLFPADLWESHLAKL